MSNENKELEVVTGDDRTLEISNVYDHLNGIKPKINEKKENIIVPKVKKTTK